MDEQHFKPKRRDDFDWENFATDYLPRLMALVGSITIWYTSITFSADGFGFVMGNKYYWVGAVIAIAGVTVPEILFNNGLHRGNLTLSMACGLAYVYGIVSNWIGLWVACGAVDPFVDPGRFALNAIVWVPAGLLIEILPEPMFNTAIGVKGAGKDFISQVIETLGLRKPGKKQDHFQERRPDMFQAQRERDGFRPQPVYNYQRDSADKPECPKCHSHNTQVQGGHFHCHNCGYACATSNRSASS